MTWTDISPAQRPDQMLKEINSQIARGLDDAVDALKWSKKHRGQRKAIDTMRLVQANLGYLAMALDWEMEADTDKASAALNKLWWKPTEEAQFEDWSMHGC